MHCGDVSGMFLQPAVSNLVPFYCHLSLKCFFSAVV